MANFKSYIFKNINYVDLILYQFGSEDCDPLHTFGPSVKNHYLFHYVLSGKGRLYPVDDQTGKCPSYLITKGQGFLITPNVINTYEADKDDPWSYMWVEFDGLKAQKYMDAIGLSAQNPVYVPKSGSSAQDAILEHISYLVEHPKADDMELLGHLLLFFNALRQNSSFIRKNNEGNLREFYVREAINFIESNYDKGISSEDVAEWCNLNRNYLGKIFKEIMNSSIQDFLIRYRLSKACEMMKNKDMKLKDIAEVNGYPNQFYFSKMFKKEYGMTPREWRAKNLEGSEKTSL